MSQSILDATHNTTQTIPIGVGAALFAGYSIDDWLLILSLCLVIFNLFRMCVWAKDRFFPKKKKK